MRKIICYFFVCLLVPVFAERYAVIVGVSDYLNNDLINDLNYCDDDAREFRDALLQDAGWSSSNISLLIDSQASKANIQSAIQHMASVAEPDDLCLIIFSGHGGQASDLSPIDEVDGSDEYLVPYDFDGTAATVILDDEFPLWIETINAGQIAIILDTCHSGGQVKQVGQNRVKSIYQGAWNAKIGDGFSADFEERSRDMDDLSGIVVVTAADDDELSWDAGPLQNGLFSYYAVRAMTEDAGNADANGNGQLSCEELFTYASPLVVSYSSSNLSAIQHPQIYDGNGTPELEIISVSGASTDDVYEPNDSLTEAYIGLGERVWLSTLSGSGIQADEDWYEITVSPSGYERVQVECVFTHADGDIDLALYDSGGTQLARSETITDNESIDYTVAAPGTYYIRVYYGNTGNTYDLWWDNVLVPTGLPDLAPAQFTGWDDYIVVSTETGTSSSVSTFTTDDILYVDFGSGNFGDGDAGEHHYGLYVDGVLEHYSVVSSCSPGYGGRIQDAEIGPLPAGEHTLEVKCDYLDEVAEQDETNNDYSRIISVVESGAEEDTLHVSFDASGGTNTSISFTNDGSLWAFDTSQLEGWATAALTGRNTIGLGGGTDHVGWYGESSLRISVSENFGDARSCSMEVNSPKETYIIVISQEASPATGNYSGGSGTEADPYQIADKQDLLDLGMNTGDYDKYFVMTADIDLSGESFASAIIAPDEDSTTNLFVGTKFSGSFDGAGYTVSNLMIDASTVGGHYLGLFGYVSGSSSSIENLRLEGVRITGGGVTSDYLGGLCGRIDSGEVRECSVSGSIGGGYNYVGGLVGLSYSAAISSCCSESEVLNFDDCWYVGGFIGVSAESSIHTCYALGEVRGASHVGGLIGLIDGGLIDTCYSACKVIGTSETGGLIGHDYQGDTSVECCFWDTQISGVLVSSGGVGITTSEMQTQSMFAAAGWDFSEVWYMDGYPGLQCFSGVAPLQVAALVINGPEIVTEESSTNYNCLAYFEDESFADVTLLANWSTDTPDMTSISNGILSVTEVGSDESCTITASYGEKTATKVITVKDVPLNVVALVVSGPDSVVEKTTTNYICTAYFADESSADVTAEASWLIDNTNIATICGGVLSAQNVSGDQTCTVTAVYQGESQSRSVTIMDTPAQGLPYNDSFETGMGLWVSSGSDFDWSLGSGSTPSPITGPSGASDGSQYLFIEATGNTQKTAGVEGSFSFSGMTNVMLTFDYHMYGQDMGILHVDVYDGVWRNAVWSRSGQQHAGEMEPWCQAMVDLTAFDGKDEVIIRFRGVVGTSYLSDMAIDNVSITGSMIATYQSWVDGYSVPVNQQGYFDAPAGDGIENIWKYAVGLSPLSASSKEDLYTCSIVSNRFCVTYLKSKDAPQADILPSWYSVLGGVWETNGLTISEIGENSTQEIWQVSAPISSNGFIRLEVELETP
ncbi:hypothetical protein EGM51_03625 [Verrucomicrobia bacterium S94]|nr:hypothetical protein EGM51_03625 [Verrucomicrobia bacterium S94]